MVKSYHYHGTYWDLLRLRHLYSISPSSSSSQEMDVGVMCFLALGRVFLEGGDDYPCDHIAMLNLAMLHTASPRRVVAETALHVLILLDKRFFQVRGNGSRIDGWPILVRTLLTKAEKLNFDHVP